MSAPRPAPRTRRWLAAAAACGSAIGALEAARALASLPHAEPLAGLALTGYAIAGHAAATLAVAWTFRHRLAPSRNRDDSVANQPGEALATAGAVALATFVALLRLRALVGFAQPALLWFVPGCLLEGAAAGFAARWALSRLAARTQRRIWGALAAAGLVVSVGLISVPLARRPLTAAGPRSGRPNILLISVDTLRADRLGAYGRTPSFTPHLDRLAAESARLANAVTSTALTGPSHTSMLTGLYPVHHGATSNGIRLRPAVDTVAETLARSGYRTGGFVSGWPLTDLSSGLARRFESYDENLARWPWFPQAVQSVPLLWLIDRTLMFAARTGSPVDPSGRFQGELFERPGERTAAHALRWISRQGSGPFFAFVHLYEPHSPYAPPLEFRRAIDPAYTGSLNAFDRLIGPQRVNALFADVRAVERIEDLYDGEVAHVDAIVGQLLEGLSRLGRDADTLVVFTADHGESLTEHGEFFGHEDFLYETTVHVPLLLRFPDRRFAGEILASQVRLVDLTPTFLELAGLRPASDLDGASLLPLLAGREPTGERIAFGSQGRVGSARRSRHYVRAHGYKLIWTLDARAAQLAGPAQEELYDLDADPGEEHDLALGTPPPIIAELRARLAEWIARRGESGASSDPEVQRHLRSLGYL